MSKYDKIRKSFIWLILFIFLTLSFSNDTFKVAKDFFGAYHMNSDLLVVGKIWADELGIDTGKSNLGRLKGILGDWPNWSDKDKWYRNDEQYVDGIHRDGTGFSIYNNDTIDGVFVEGHGILFVNGENATIINVKEEMTESGEYLCITLSEENISKEKHGSILEWKVFNSSGEEQDIIVYSPYESQWGGQGWFLSKIFNMLDMRSINEHDSVYVLRTVVATLRLIG